MILRFRENDRNDVHCWVSVFSAVEGPTTGHSGVLVLDTPVWDALRATFPRQLGRVRLDEAKPTPGYQP